MCLAWVHTCLAGEKPEMNGTPHNHRTERDRHGRRRGAGSQLGRPRGAGRDRIPRPLPAASVGESAPRQALLQTAGVAPPPLNERKRFRPALVVVIACVLPSAAVPFLSSNTEGGEFGLVCLKAAELRTRAPTWPPNVFGRHATTPPIRSTAVFVLEGTTHVLRGRAVPPMGRADAKHVQTFVEVHAIAAPSRKGGATTRTSANVAHQPKTKSRCRTPAANSAFEF